MHSERGRKGLLLIVCAWTILTAGPGLTVYGAGTGTETQIRHWNIGDTVIRNIGEQHTVSAALIRIMQTIWITTEREPYFCVMR